MLCIWPLVQASTVGKRWVTATEASSFRQPLTDEHSFFVVRIDRTHIQYTYVKSHWLHPLNYLTLEACMRISTYTTSFCIVRRQWATVRGTIVLYWSCRMISGAGVVRLTSSDFVRKRKELPPLHHKMIVKCPFWQQKWVVIQRIDRSVSSSFIGPKLYHTFHTSRTSYIIYSELLICAKTVCGCKLRGSTYSCRRSLTKHPKSNVNEWKHICTSGFRPSMPDVFQLDACIMKIMD